MKNSHVTKVSDYGAREENTLTLTIDLDSSYQTLESGTYSVLRQHWEKKPRLVWAGPPEDGSIFEEHYTQQKNMLILTMKLTNRSENLWIYPEFLADINLQWMAYTQPQKNRKRPLPLDPLAMGPASLVLSLTSKHFPVVASGKPPLDIALLPGILMPPMDWLYTGGALMYTDVFLASFNYIPTLNESSRHLQAQPLQAVPLTTFISSTAGPQKLAATPLSARPTWTVEQPSAGSIKTIDGAQHYQPPGPLGPNAITNPDCKTLIPAMLKSSTRQILLPAVADILKATTGTGKAYATWVSEYFAQTHYFKAAKQLGKLQLSMYFTSLTGVERPVPLQNITWHTLAGNGKVNSQGVFTPDSSSPSPCTVILAVDEDKTEEKESWYWAMTIIPHPFIEVDAMLELFSD